ncbi:uncharacterized protein EDB91DRAFT_1239993 [Suillus paluster]|uniref:uncharacterized protein n=1 Tax=Suillus paluster TaxID=48578 RepID=UPI001B886CF3|nr:uncharacterized protein EDB91DRAFT_1239993 [Suillus paluster]KAG1724212.1 hypothetical protein EDB91DRAFT_1239993 [Suillus paluster]
MEERDHFLLELLRLEGRRCTNAPEFRCEDCLGTELYCKACTVERHIENPTHRIENGQHFEDTDLQDLGLQVQLGHPPGEHCSNPSSAHNDFVVLDINGVHNITLHFCECQMAQSRTTQLLRMCWFPATTLEPKTTAMFRLLHHFHILLFELKASTFEYWQTLARLTNNTGVNPPKATQHGACAVLCPACPQPGKNLPSGWEDTPFEQRWKYSLFLAIDANFRLVHKNVSSNKADPGLNKGWAYFVEEKAFKKFLHDTGKQPQEKSSCASHNTVNLAETKNSCGLAATGASTVDCSRHNMKCPCGVGDLQKGKRYINMDYLFFSTLQYSKDVVTLNVSYDIACQWSKNLWDCMATYPCQMHVERSTKEFVFLVPKFHLPAHIAFCQVTYSHNLIKGMGRTDGEAPERGWANINPVATSTREMGPGSCRDTLDDHFGDFNWKKVTNFPIPQHDQHLADFNDFNDTLWKLAIEGWEADRSQTNPFEVTTTTMSLAAVRLCLSQKEAEDLEHDLNYSLHTEVSPSVLVLSGIEIEDQQCRLEREYAALGAHPTDLQLMKLQERSNALQCKIEQWCKVQVLYMPMVVHVRISDTASTVSSWEEKPYEVKLWLPSQLKRASKRILYEWELRQAQAFDALDDLRRHLRLRSHLYKFKDNQLHGQWANTHAVGVLAKVELSIKTDSEWYRRAWTALVILGDVLQEHSWRDDLLKLEPEHVRGMSDGHIGQSEGNRTLSWIWKARSVTTGDRKGETVLADVLHVEWCKSRARTHRWTEEVELLQEEMRRMCTFFNWHAVWWKDQANRRIGLDIAELEGLEAYAKRQAALRIMMQDNCLRKWRAVPVSLPPAVAVP